MLTSSFTSMTPKIIKEYFALFPKDSENLTTLDIGNGEMGAKRSLNGVRNNNTPKILLSKAKFAQKLTFLRGDFTPSISKSCQI